ncbi:MAG: hypothetical protein IPH88_19370 [Bacteroidales bacterium]|nr:hypothetical protein [Bacteroidales bacterium]
MKYIFIAFLFLFLSKKKTVSYYPVSIVAGDSIGVGVLYTNFQFLIPSTIQNMSPRLGFWI